MLFIYFNRFLLSICIVVYFLYYFNIFIQYYTLNNINNNIIILLLNGFYLLIELNSIYIYISLINYNNFSTKYQIINFEIITKKILYSLLFWNMLLFILPIIDIIILQYKNKINNKLLIICYLNITNIFLYQLMSYINILFKINFKNQIKCYDFLDFNNKKNNIIYNNNDNNINLSDIKSFNSKIIYEDDEKKNQEIINIGN